MTADEKRTRRAERGAEVDETQLKRAQHSIDEARNAAEKDRRLAEAQTGFEGAPSEEEDRTDRAPW